MQRENWGSRVGFILAAVGSAIGLGNIWRFPYMAYDNGGGAFLIPYFFALVTAGIPILIMEFSMGHKMKGGAPLTMAKLNRKWEWLGWWQILISFIITVYYVVVISWAINYVGFSMTLAWGNETINFFTGDYLGLTGGPFEFGGLQPTILITTISAWIINFIVIYSGVKSGIERANKIFIPVLIVILMIILLRGITLPGAAEGLNMLFQPDFSKIADGKVWVAAYGQIFFSLSIAFAIMITYSSYLPKKSDIVNNAFITGFINCGFSVLAGIAIFSILGFMMGQSGGELPAKLSGVFLAFATIPEAINQLPAFQKTIGVLFFISLTFAGLSSFISLNEAAIAGITEKLYKPRKKVAAWYTLFAMIISLIFTTGSGLYILDIVDHFVNSFGVAMSGLVEVILIGWFFKIKILKDHFQPISDFKVGIWWDIAIKIITPAALGITAIMNFANEFNKPYGGYDKTALILFGWCVVVGIIILGIYISTKKWKNVHIFDYYENDDNGEEV